MSKFIIKNGSFLNKESGETADSITGKIAGIRTVTNDEGVSFVQVDLCDGTGDEASVNTLSVRKYGDASLKILRCLYGIVDIIADKTVTVSLEKRENRSTIISLAADGEELVAMGVVEPYASEKKMLTDKMVACLKRAFSFRRDVLVYHDCEHTEPETEGFDSAAAALAGYISELRRLGYAERQLTVKKYSFTNEHAANAYMKALSDLSCTNAFKVFTDSADIDVIWNAYTEEIPAAPADGDIEEEC